MMAPPRPEAWCSLPWLSLEFSDAMGIRPCSHSRDFFPLSSTNLHDLWRSRDMGNARYEIVSGRRPKGCSSCTQLEDQGMKSPRQIENEKQPFKDHRALEKLALTSSPFEFSMRLEEGVTSILSFPENQTVIRNWAPTLQKISFQGDEPFRHSSFLSTLKTLRSSGEAGHVNLTFFSDLGNFENEVTELIPHFRKTEVFLNFLDFGSRQDFINSHKWETIEKNLRKYQALSGERTSIVILCRVNIFNMFSLAEILEWLKANFPEFKISLDFQSATREFSIRNLPPKAKSELGHILKFITADSYNFIEGSGVRPVLEYLGLEGDIHLIRSGVTLFLQSHNRLEEDFKRQFPKLSGFIQETV